MLVSVGMSECIVYSKTYYIKYISLVNALFVIIIFVKNEHFSSVNKRAQIM